MTVLINEKIKSAWFGNESLALVFWGYYVLGMFGVTLLLGLLVVVGDVYGITGLRVVPIFLSIIYFLWAAVSVWRSARNVKKIYRYGARAVVLFGAISFVYRFYEWLPF